MQKIHISPRTCAEENTSQRSLTVYRVPEQKQPRFDPAQPQHRDEENTLTSSAQMRGRSWVKVLQKGPKSRNPRARSPTVRRVRHTLWGSTVARVEFQPSSNVMRWQCGDIPLTIPRAVFAAGQLPQPTKAIHIGGRGLRHPVSPTLIFHAKFPISGCTSCMRPWVMPN